MDEGDSGSSKPAETVPKNVPAEGLEPTVGKAGAAPQHESGADSAVPPPTKITVVRSQKSLTDLPAMKPPGDAEPVAPTATVHSAQPAAQPAEPAIPAQAAQGVQPVSSAQLVQPVQTAKPGSAENTPATKTPVGNTDSAANQIPTAGESAGIENSLVQSSPTLSADSKFLTENLARSREEAIASELEAKGSRTKVTFPDPEQPLQPPQAPPQFLGDQSHTRPSDSSLDRSQFGTASQFGGAPIALLTNVSRSKKPAKFSFMPTFIFIKSNLIACALTLSMVVLATLILTNKEPRSDSKIDSIKSLDLSILTTGQSLEQVNQLVNAKKYPEALALCDRIIQKDTKFAEAYHSRGQVYMAMHRFREAVDDFTTAESFNHRSVDIHIDRAAALFQAQDYEKAKHEYDEILVFEPNNSAAYFGKGLAEENLGLTKEALSDFQKTISLQADYASANEEMGTIYFTKGDLVEAYEQYTKAIATAPDVPRFYFNRANALKQDHQLTRAIADYCKAIQLDGSSPEFFNNRGLLYLENNETAKAITDFSSAVDLDPNYTIAKHNLTLAQQRLRR